MARLSGNNIFNSLGIVAVNSEAALLFLDFDRGRTLQLSGIAEIDGAHPTEPAMTATPVALPAPSSTGWWPATSSTSSHRISDPILATLDLLHEFGQLSGARGVLSGGEGLESYPILPGALHPEQCRQESVPLPS